MQKKKLLRLLILLLAVIGIGAGWWWNSYEREQEDTNRLVLYGNIDIREAHLAFNNSEHITAILVQEGDRVRKGQLLATLDRSRKEAEVAAAEAKVAAQQAVVKRLVAGTRPEEIRQAEADVAAAEARLANARITYQRAKELRESSAGSQQALDDAAAALRTAKADLKVKQETLALALEGPRIEDIEEAKATLEADRAKLTLVREVLKDTKLYAPADGIIRDRLLEPGDMVTPQTPVLTLALTNPLWVRAYAPETVLGKLSPGMRAEVSTDSYPGKTYRGWIGFISPTAEFTPKNVETPELRTRLVYQLRVYVCNPEDELRLGMPATVTIALDQPRPAPDRPIPDCTAGQTVGTAEGTETGSAAAATQGTD